MSERPKILTITSGGEIRRWYWMKDELIAAARHHGLKTTGGKFEILDRIAHFLDTGETKFPGDIKAKVTSKFDWTSEALHAETVLTDSYKNCENVRAFFAAATGTKFKFNIALMDWIKANHGKTLGDAVASFQANQAQGAQTQIKSHNQFNQYTRDFMDTNPGASMADVRRIWAKKRALPMDDGRHRYDPSDLEL